MEATTKRALLEISDSRYGIAWNELFYENHRIIAEYCYQLLNL